MQMHGPQLNYANSENEYLAFYAVWRYHSMVAEKVIDLPMQAALLVIVTWASPALQVAVGLLCQTLTAGRFMDFGSSHTRL